MEAIYRLARERGVAVECADLGDWGAAELRAEYDPAGPTIRINARALQRLPAEERDAFAARAVAHELYHHAERLGEIPHRADPMARERAADDFACEMLRCHD
ncbi:MAG: hypothetical protein ACYCX6_02550 [Vulcanimicrobiaceae bacterium]